MKRTAPGLVLCIACLLLIACASASSGPPGLRDVRQVVLMREVPPYGIWPNPEEMLASFSQMATDRFNAEQSHGYVTLVFSNPDSHRVTVALLRQGGDSVYQRTLDIDAQPQFSEARGTFVEFPIRGQLAPGRYLIELTIDDRHAGTYPFTVE